MYQVLKTNDTKALGTSFLIIPELRVLVLTKRHVGCGKQIAQENNSGLTLVKDAINFVDPKNCYSLSAPPRKSLETPVVVVNVGENILCYFPRENSWCKLGEIPAEFIRHHKFVPCDGQLCSTLQESWSCKPQSLKLLTCNPYSNKCVLLPSLEEPGRYLRKTFVRNGDEMYALMSQPCAMDHLLNWLFHDGVWTYRRLGRISDSSRTEIEQK